MAAGNLRQNKVTAGGIAAIVEGTYTRPADTNIYAAGDVIANSTSAATILTFSSAVRAETGTAIIQAATLVDSVAAATKLDADLYLFDTTVVMEQDNAAWDPSDAEMLTCLGVIEFRGANFKTCGGNGITHVQGIGLPIVSVGGSSIFGILVARNAYTPASAEVLTVRLHILQD